MGADLLPQVLTVNQVVDYVAAVLDDAQVNLAVIYSTYTAAGFGIRYFGKVPAMIFDSPLSLLSWGDIVVVRDATPYGRVSLLDG
ncbi:hypothetical protein [Mycobacterium leprae]|uniref:hypothetical protein n=1 Tax=Mycobacterium leprae TaxID=1769 RepID=UPI00031C7D75